jgi:hypothetical protein
MQPLVSSACCCSQGFLCVVQVVLYVLLFTEIPACCFTQGSLRVLVHRNSFLLLFLIGSFLMLLTGFLLVRNLLTIRGSLDVVVYGVSSAFFTGIYVCNYLQGFLYCCLQGFLCIVMGVSIRCKHY